MGFPGLASCKLTVKMKMRVLLLSALLALAPAAAAQTMPTPKTDIAALRREALNDRAVRVAIGDLRRSTESLLKDQRRDVGIILKASKAKAGDRVLDIGSSNAYLALLFATLVGPEGHVDIHNTPSWIAQAPRLAEEVQRRWIKRPNVGWLIRSWNAIDAPAESYDVIVLGRIYHEILLEGGDADLVGQRLFKMLKPGGHVLVEDHDIDPAKPVRQQVFLHRISHQNTAKDFTAAGFDMTELILFESAADDQRFNVIWPGIRGRTAHYIAVFQKPMDGKPAQ